MQNAKPRTLAAVPAPATNVGWSTASEAFLRRDLALGTARVYRLTLAKVGAALGAETDLARLTPSALAVALGLAYPSPSPASWNRHLATLRSFAAFAQRQGWLTEDPTSSLEARKVSQDHSRALSPAEVERLLHRRDVSVRDRCLWRMLYETAARTDEILRLNVEDLDLAARRAVTLSKGGDRDVLHYATGTARLLPKVLDGRLRGPVFLTERAHTPGRAPALADLDLDTGRARLSYRRAAEVFQTASGGATLHQLRHSALTHLADEGVPTVLLMAKSRHANLRTLQRYVRPSVEAVARLTADHDPARRR